MSEITPLPTPPSRAVPSTFSTTADAFLSALPLFVTEANALAAQVNSESLTVTAALNDSAFATYSSMATMWVSGTTYAQGALVWSPASSLMYRRKVAGAGTTDPSLDSSNWVQFQRELMDYRGRTSNTQLTASDKGAFVNISSGTFTQTFAACSALGYGWWVYIRNAGTGDITLDPNGSETIDSLTTFIMYPGEVRLIHCDGSVLRSVVITGFRRKWTATGTFVVPPGYSSYTRKLASGSGGGGSGGRYADGTTSWGGAGGGGGGLYTDIVYAATPGASVTITIGSYGVGGAAISTNDTQGNNGTNGGNTSISGAGFPAVTVQGGKGGGYGSSAGCYGAEGGGIAAGATTSMVFGYIYARVNASVGNPAEFGGGATGNNSVSNGSPGSSGSSVFGGGGGGGGCGYNGSAATTVASGGTSTLGGAGGTGGGAATAGANGTASTEYAPGGGGGGGASKNGTASGKGGDGQPGHVTITGVV